MRTSRNVTFVRCGLGPGGYVYGTITYEIYSSTDDLGTYVFTETGSCTEGQDFSWDPSEPSVTFSDPNLP